MLTKPQIIDLCIYELLLNYAISSEGSQGVIRKLSGARQWLVRDEHFTDEPRTSPGLPGWVPDDSWMTLGLPNTSGPEPGPAKDKPGPPRTAPDRAGWAPDHPNLHPGPRTGEMYPGFISNNSWYRKCAMMSTSLPRHQKYVMASKS